jgi:hypothetical protein
LEEKLKLALKKQEKLETLAKDAANEKAELRDRNKALENEINVTKTKLSFEQQESKFKQDRL